MTSWPNPAAGDLLAELNRQLALELPSAHGLRRELHRHPDLSGKERPTAERLRHALPQLKFTRIAETGFLTRIGPPGPAVVIRAELDALPMTERTAVDWASTNGAMHACGHDVHLAALWAVVAAARRLTLPVGLIALFQPREEVQPSGAEDILEQNSLAGHDIRAILGAHVQPRVPAAVISTGAGAVNAAADEFDIVVHGHGGHGAYPHVTVDPIPVLVAIAQGLGELVGRIVDPVHPAVITIGRISAGTSHNVIPQEGSLHGIVRTMHVSDQALLHAAIIQLAEQTAAARGAYAEVRLTNGHPVLVNDSQLVDLVDPLLGQVGLSVAAEPFRSLGADDFAHYSQLAPSLMMFVGTGSPDTGTRHRIGLHHPEFLPRPEVLDRTAKALLAGYVGACRLVGEPDQASEIRSA